MPDARDLAHRLADLLRREHAAMADFVVALADFDRERRWMQLGHTGLSWRSFALRRTRRSARS